MRSIGLCLLLGAITVAAPGASSAMSDKDGERMTIFATMLGRLIGCGLPSSKASSEVAAWMARHNPSSDPATPGNLAVFTIGVQHHTAEQKAGRSPDSCADVQEFFASPEYKRVIAK